MTKELVKKETHFNRQRIAEAAGRAHEETGIMVRIQVHQAVLPNYFFLGGLPTNSFKIYLLHFYGFLKISTGNKSSFLHITKTRGFWELMIFDPSNQTAPKSPKWL